MMHRRGSSRTHYHSSWEADEQSGAIRCGAGGAKGGGQGECAAAKHGPDTRVGEPCHKGWSAYGKPQGKGRRRSSPRSSTTSASICSTRRSSNQEDVRAGRRWSDLDGLRTKPRAQSRGPACSHPSGAYRALPSRRKYIPKPDGRQRPLAIAALEDKIVQRATVAVLNAIYEEDFLGFSYGFRAGRGTHDALDALVVGIESTKVNWILDADVRSFFDEISQQWLVRFLEHRIGDRRIRLIQKWLKVGILEEGVVTVSERGTGQGAVISPLLPANVYLHYVLDLWAGRWRRRKATGDHDHRALCRRLHCRFCTSTRDAPTLPRYDA